MDISGSTRIGVVGTGFIATNLINMLEHMDIYSVNKVLTRRPLTECSNLKFHSKLTQSKHELIEQSDILVECSGDPIFAADVVNLAMLAGIPVVTMNTEFHVTLGSYFADKGIISEAEGDQPGSTAALYEDCVKMGFKPLVFGNMKGFLNTSPKPEDMAFWSDKNKITIAQTTSFTDGTKIQFEQALVANGLDGTIAKQGLLGLQEKELEVGAKKLGEIAKSFDRPIADYVLSHGQFAGVFIVAEHDAENKDALRYFKLGDGPYYVLLRPFHLCYLEIPKTIERILRGDSVLLNNSTNPKVSIAAISKKELNPGDVIETPIGGFDIRGEAVLICDEPKHIPLGLLKNATVTRKIEKGAMLTWDDVDIPDTFALEIASKLYG